MSPIAHAELSWLLAVPLARDRRQRAWATLAGLAPDLDGLTLAAFPWDHGEAYGRYHHVLTHGFVAALAMALLAWFAARPGARGRMLVLALLAFHLHLLCDLMGSGRDWPIAYLWPVSAAELAPFRWGWELASWQNATVAVSASFTILAVGAWRGFSIVELVSLRGDAAFVEVLRLWRARLSGSGQASGGAGPASSGRDLD